VAAAVASQAAVPSTACVQLLIHTIDGFALNAGGWTNQDYYVRYSSEIFEAAYRLNSGFKLMFSADMCCGNGLVDVEDMIRRFANNSRYQGVYYKRDGKYMLSTFAGEALGTGFWKQVKSDLTNGTNPSTYNKTNALPQATGVASSAPLPVFLMPAFFWGGETPGTAQIQQGLSQYQKIIDGSFYWGIAGVPGLGSTPD
jgi:glucan endo-1,3-alpha-glucosidase